MFIHEPTDDPTWQESNECHAYDPDLGVGFVTASGAFVNRGSGQAYVGAYVTTPDGRQICFQQTVPDAPLSGADRSSSRNGVGFLHWDWLAADVGRLTVDTPECAIDVVFTDFYEPAHWGTGPVPGATGHVESSGRVTGTVEVDGFAVEVDLLGHRDQSWGPRSLAPLRSHAWLAGTCGPELSFTTENLVVQAGTTVITVRSGFVVTDEGLAIVSRPDLVYGLDWDVRTPLDVQGVIETDQGVTYSVAALRRSPTFRNHRIWPDAPGQLTATDTLFEVRVGERVGIACLNLVTNHTGGGNEISMLSSTPSVDGVWSR